MKNILNGIIRQKLQCIIELYLLDLLLTKMKRKVYYKNSSKVFLGYTDKDNISKIKENQ